MSLEGEGHLPPPVLREQPPDPEAPAAQCTVTLTSEPDDGH